MLRFNNNYFILKKESEGAVHPLQGGKQGKLPLKKGEHRKCVNFSLFVILS